MFILVFRIRQILVLKLMILSLIGNRFIVELVYQISPILKRNEGSVPKNVKVSFHVKLFFRLSKTLKIECVHYYLRRCLDLYHIDWFYFFVPTTTTTTATTATAITIRKKNTPSCSKRNPFSPIQFFKKWERERGEKKLISNILLKYKRHFFLLPWKGK